MRFFMFIVENIIAAFLIFMFARDIIDDMAEHKERKLAYNECDEDL